MDTSELDTSASCDAVAARNGLWDTLRCRPYHAAAVEQEDPTAKSRQHACDMSGVWPPHFSST